MRFRDASAIIPLCLISMIIASFSATLPIRAWSLQIGDRKLGITMYGTFVTKYIWRGYDLFGNRGAWQPSITLDYEGLYAGVWGSWAVERGRVDATELDYYVGYGRSFFDRMRYAVQAVTAYTYYDFPKSDTLSGEDGIGDAQELTFGVSLPRLFPVGASSLVPSYVGYYEWAGIQNSDDVDNGWIHTFGLGYDLPIPKLIKNLDEQTLSLNWDITYNDGTFGSRPGWSHSTARLAAGVTWRGLSFTSALHHQWSFEATVNDEDELYGSFSLTFEF
jgi:hypothetical protein